MLASLAQSASPSSGGLPLFVPLLIGLGLGFIPANIAKKKGYSAGGFYVFGVLFFLIAVIVAVCLKDKTLTTSTVLAGRTPAVDPGITWTHTGVRYMLGYTAQSPSYGIWDRQHPGPATAKFPFTEQGKAEALTRFQQLEPQGQTVGVAAMPPPPAPTGDAGAWSAGPTR
jgi:hypothetical protein